MSWTTVCDLVFKTQITTIITDSSGFNNKAENISNLNIHNDYAEFVEPNDQIVIPIKDTSLQEFSGLKVECDIYPVKRNHRYNLVEGWMSFAFFIEADGRLKAGIYDGHNWVAVESNTPVPLEKWSKVTLQYDGISLAILKLNGVMVGVNYNMPTGMLQPQQIIAIGHWPNGDNRYTYHGRIAHVKIKRKNIKNLAIDANNLLFCNLKPLTDEQILAYKEMLLIIEHLDEEVRKKLQDIIFKKYQNIIQLLNILRNGSKDNLAIHRKVVRMIIKVWCTEKDTKSIKKILSDFFDENFDKNDPLEYQQLVKIMAACLEILSITDIDSQSLEDTRELLFQIVPETLEITNDKLSVLVQNIL